MKDMTKLLLVLQKNKQTAAKEISASHIAIKITLGKTCEKFRNNLSTADNLKLMYNKFVTTLSTCIRTLDAGKRYKAHIAAIL